MQPLLSLSCRTALSLFQTTLKEKKSATEHCVLGHCVSALQQLREGPIQKVDVAGVFSKGSAISTAYISTSVPHGSVAGSCPWLADILSSDVVQASYRTLLREVQFD